MAGTAAVVGEMPVWVVGPVGIAAAVVKTLGFEVGGLPSRKDSKELSRQGKIKMCG